MSRALQLPPPRKTIPLDVDATRPKASITTATTTTLAISTESGRESHTVAPVAPSYEHRCSSAAAAAKARGSPEVSRPKLFVPRRLADFDDGGAFPEIHVAQYPRHMGNPHKPAPPTQPNGASSRPASGIGGAVNTGRTVVNVEVDAQGEIAYDAIVTGGTNSDRIVYTKWEDVRGGAAIPQDVALPTPEEEAEETARTQAALSALVVQHSKTNAKVKPNVDTPSTEFIKYTARPDAPGYNPAAATRVIQMVPALVDPLMPPKHKHVKAPRGPAEDIVPVLHAPSTKKLSKEEQDAWKVPACISNWKNQRGYTIPLDKRLAADGRGLVSHTDLNTTNFAAFSESLWTAERLARAEVQNRAKTQQALAHAASRDRDQALRDLAQQARRERGGQATTTTSVPAHIDTEAIDAVPQPLDHDSDDSLDETPRKPSATHSGHGAAVVPDVDETEDVVAARQRDRLRDERKRERERALRAEQNVQLQKKQRLEEERDVSEQIALGVHVAAATTGGDANVDARLYQSAGLNAGFGAEDEYNAYSKPLFAAANASSSLYRPTRGDTDYNADEQYDQLQAGGTSKFQPHKGFDGANQGGGTGAGPRTEPVQFERAPSK